MVPYLADALVLSGLFALSVGVYGMVRMPGNYLKLHATSAALILGVLPVLAAAAATGEPTIAYRAALVATLLLLTSPVSAHTITKAAYRRGEDASGEGPSKERGR